MVPKPDVSLVTTFFFDRIKNRRTFLFPPLLRSQVLDLKPVKGDHVLVYLTSGFEQFVEMLKQFPRERFVVYGQGDRGDQGNLVFKAPSTDGFLRDLATCKGVMATAGFTLITEALYLKKPYLALPMAGQFEQAINALFLEKLNCGVNLHQLDPAGIGYFLYRLPEFEEALAGQPSFDNAPLLEKVDALLANNAEEARRFHQQRKQLSSLP
jgi:uncharacterized protein (TIGR00661 family)